MKLQSLLHAARSLNIKTCSLNLNDYELCTQEFVSAFIGVLFCDVIYLPVFGWATEFLFHGIGIVHVKWGSTKFFDN